MEAASTSSSCKLGVERSSCQSLQVSDVVVESCCFKTELGELAHFDDAGKVLLDLVNLVTQVDDLIVEFSIASDISGYPPISQFFNGFK